MIDDGESYCYNERNELIKRISAGILTTYSYDKNGSIISEEEEGRKSRRIPTGEAVLVLIKDSSIQVHKGLFG